VYLCAVVLEAGLSLADQGLEQITPEFANGWVKGLSEPDEQGRTVWVDFAAHPIGADIVELPGSHSPLLSRPSAVAEVLLRVADKK